MFHTWPYRRSCLLLCWLLCIVTFLWSAGVTLCRNSRILIVDHQLQHPSVLSSTLDQSNSSIPCIVHQSWKTRTLPSSRTARWRQTWSKCLPECRKILWTDSDNDELVARHFPWLVPVYNSMKSGVHRADVARILYLLHYGGIYADLDTVCVRKFRPLLHGWRLVFGGMEGRWHRSINGSYVQNSFMASTPGHPFWLGLLHQISRRQRRKIPSGTEEVAGPLILMEELQKYLDDGFDDAVVFPPSYFNPFSWITNKRQRCKTRGAMSSADEAACLSAFPEAYVVQLHMKSWGGGKA